MTTSKEIFVAGNQLVIRRGDTYGGGKKCGEDVACGVPTDTKRFRAPSDNELVVVNPQAVAVDVVFKLIQQKVLTLLKGRFLNNRLAGTIISDDYAIYDIAKRGEVDERFIHRFHSESGKSLDDTGGLLGEIADHLQKIKADLAITLQLDQSGSLHHYLAEGAEGRIGEILKERGLVYDARDGVDAAAELHKLIERLGYPKPESQSELKALVKSLKLISFRDDAPMVRTRVKPAISGAAGRFVPLPLDLFKPEVLGLVSNHLNGSIFNPGEITVEPERVVRDMMPIEAERMGWEDPGDANFDTNGKPYHLIKNAFVLDSHGRFETKCLGVVLGTFVRLASQHPGATVHYIMEQDLKEARVDDGVIKAGLRLFEEKWLPSNPENRIFVSYKMVGPGIIRN